MSPSVPPVTGAGRPATLDSSEEITPEELASIPEPFPAPSETSEKGGRTAQAVKTGDVTGSAPPAAPDRSSQPGYVWRVQIFAAQDAALADRKAREAAERLHVRAHVQFEPPHYKVRLGDYASEAEAQALRERAIEVGYAGAFRVRCASDTSSHGN